MALMVKQMVQQSAMSMVKDTLLGSLRGMGCKGIALSNALGALDMRGGGARTALSGSVAGMAGMAGMPAGGAAAALSGLVQPGALPAGSALDASQLAALQQALSAMNQPTSPAETLATLDEMADIGLLPKAMQSEMKECMALLPQSAASMGMAMGMLKPMLPQMREARAQMHALSPEEQDEMAATMAAELQSTSAEDRQSFVEVLDGGFFPPRVVDGVKSKLGAK
jgi:hypothetical protein